MRILQGIVAAQAIVLVVLFGLNWQRGDAAPPPPMPGAVVMPSSGSVAGEAASLPPGTAPVDATDRHSVAGTGEGASAPAIVLQGRLLGLEPPPKDDIVRLSCRREDTYRSANVNNGGYAIAGLSPGTWQLRCEVEGCRLQEFDIVLDTAAVQRRDLTLVPAMVLPVFLRTTTGGRLQTEIAKLGIWQSLQVIATAEPLRNDLDPTENSSVFDLGLARHRRTGNQGADEEGGDGTLELDVDPPLYATLLLRHLKLAEQRIEPGQQELRFTVDLGDVVARTATVRMRVLDSAGQPVAKARIELSTAQGGGSHGMTADDGTVTIEKVMAGLTYFGIWGKEQEQFATHLTLAAGAKLDLGDIVLRPNTKMLGHVVDESGNGVAASLQWTALDLWQPPHPMLDRRNSLADGDGNFELSGGAGRRYVVRANCDDGRIGYAFFDANGANERTVLTVHATTKVLLDGKPKGLRTFAVVVRDPKEQLLDVRILEPRWPNGSLSLPRGDYVLEVYDSSGTRLRHTPLTVGGETLHVEVP